jgi:hypothetical protein
MLRQIWGKRGGAAQAPSHITQMPIIEKGCPAISVENVRADKILFEGVSY